MVVAVVVSSCNVCNSNSNPNSNPAMSESYSLPSISLQKNSTKIWTMNQPYFLAVLHITLLPCSSLSFKSPTFQFVYSIDSCLANFG